MSFWTRDPREIDAELADSLAHSPSGGRLKMWLLGGGLALVPIGYGFWCLHSGRATLFDSHTNLELTGSSAVAAAIAYIAIGLFIHAHWFWGLHPKLQPWNPIIKIIAALIFIGCLGFVAYRVIAF